MFSIWCFYLQNMCAVSLRLSSQQANTPLSDKTDLHESECPAGEGLSQQCCWVARAGERLVQHSALQERCHCRDAAVQPTGGWGQRDSELDHHTAPCARQEVERQDIKFRQTKLWVDLWRHLTAHIWPSFSQKQTVPSCVFFFFVPWMSHAFSLLFCFFKLWCFFFSHEIFSLSYYTQGTWFKFDIWYLNGV